MKQKLIIVMFLWLLPIFSYADPISDLQTEMQQMVKLWNQGDVKQFVTFYKNAPDTLYISKTVLHGYPAILNRYEDAYPTNEDMGKLSFANLEVKMLSDNYAIVVGNWNLDRPKKGNIGGIFSLVFENTVDGWKIFVDHTS